MQNTIKNMNRHSLHTCMSEIDPSGSETSLGPSNWGNKHVWTYGYYSGCEKVAQNPAVLAS